MDSFTSSVNSQVIYLDGYDTTCSTLSIPLCYWYKNDSPGSANEFMPAKVLEDAFYKALLEFPILAGYIRTNSYSRMYIDVNKDNLNMPVYTDTTACCNLTYSAISDSGFDLRKLPINLRGKYGVPAPVGLFNRQIKPAFFHILRFKDNGGVFIYASVLHCLVDGYGFVSFMNRWAEIAKWMQQPEDVKEKQPLPTRKYTHDRLAFASLRSDETSALDSKLVNYPPGFGLYSKWLASRPTSGRGRILKEYLESRKYVLSTFHIPSKTLENLRDSVQKHAPAGVKYSINDIITAYISIVCMKAEKKELDDESKKPLSRLLRMVNPYARQSKGQRKLDLEMAVNIRPRVKDSRPDAMDYMGNMAFGKGIELSTDVVNVEPTDEALSVLALKIHELVKSADEQYFSQLKGFLERKPDNYLRKLFGASRSNYSLLVSSHTSFPHYNVDFGAGIPALVHKGPHTTNEVVYVMPAHPSVGGYVIETKFSPAATTNIIQNSNWMKLVDKFDSFL
ncbi:hypothetical protein H4S06_000010 [Coemansia sp. BCRC 34490]|nr:hypothetical protein H4S06_000010 [Coemansia sp. BCRC 34490]